MQTPMPNIDEVVELLGLEIDPKSNRNSDTYNVRCPLCGDKKFHMNINRRKNAYYCVLCTGDSKKTGVLDLYGRVRFGTPLIPGTNGKELKSKLLEELGRGGPTASPYNNQRGGRFTPAALPDIPVSKLASDEDLHKTYSVLLRFNVFKLSNEHFRNLVKRGLSKEIIIRNGYRTVPNDFSWVSKYKKFTDIWKRDKLYEVKNKFSRIKRLDDKQLIAGLILADVLLAKGCVLEGIPGIFQMKGYWCVLLEPGMLIPTRNKDGLIVGIQTRKDSGNVRYITLSSKGLPYGPSEGISRTHFPIGNYGPDENTPVILTEGPLKADVASYLYGSPTYFIAVQGVQNTRELPEIFNQLKFFGVTDIQIAFDMDRLCNKNVRKATTSIMKKIKDAGLNMRQKFWDTEFAAKKWAELHELCQKMNVSYDNKSSSVFVQIGSMAAALDEIMVEHSIIHNEDGTEAKNYWSDKTKGIDDYLLSLRQSTAAGSE